MDETMILDCTSVTKFSDLFYRAFIDYIELLSNLDINKITFNDFLAIKKQVSNTFSLILAQLPPNKIIDVKKEQSNYFIVNALILGGLIELINQDDNIDNDEMISSLLAKIKSILLY